jgi:hypothetical protein
MSNIKFHYQYRDAGNYKNPGNVVFALNTDLTIEDATEKIREHLFDEEFFDPIKWQIPPVFFEDEEEDEELDHDWHEFLELQWTTDPETDSRTFEQFLKFISIRQE